MNQTTAMQCDLSNNKQGPQSYYLAIAQGFFAMVLFSLTVPMTKLALIQFSPELIAACRGLGAGLLSLAIVQFNRWAIPKPGEIIWLLLAGSGVVIGFPYLLAKTLNSISASDMGVILAGLPLATSLTAVLVLKERYNIKFWACSLIGAAVLITYFQQAIPVSDVSSSTENVAALALATLFFGGVGYACGAKSAKTLGAWPTICWALVLYLPVSAFMFGMYFQEGFSALDSQASNTNISAYLALAYLVIMSQWLGFRFWYGAMAKAGAGTISQLQLIQPFFTLLFASLLLSDTLDSSQLIYAAAIMMSIAGALKFKTIAKR
ncbi:MAG: DMT family transporter [Pseudomonadales bacterium]|nr:DMT family transporter [Pseudomonadales bacterium]